MVEKLVEGVDGAVHGVLRAGIERIRRAVVIGGENRGGGEECGNSDGGESDEGGARERRGRSGRDGWRGNLGIL